MTLHAEFTNALQQHHIEARFDLPTRILYSTDASIYQIEPIGVVFPRSPDDLAAIVTAAGQYRVPLLARGAGSSLAGQAIGPALILDCSRYLTRILEINPEEHTATVEPGVILDSLNKAAARHALQFGPDPASMERATMGGSIANNATGAHSILYGMAADHLLSTDVVLSDGCLTSFAETHLDRAKEIALGKGVEASLYETALDIRSRSLNDIEKGWPRTWRRAAGYNLNYLLPWSPSSPPGWDGQFERAPYLPYPPITPGTVNLSTLLAGSEGTLAIIHRAKVRLVPLPGHKILAVLAFQDIASACDAAPELLQLNPSAIELIPGLIVDLARSVPAFANQLSFLDQLRQTDGASPDLLAVEFSGEDLNALRHKINALRKQIGQTISMLISETAELQKQVWAVRKVGLGLLSSRPGDLKSTAFIEDLSVPAENLGGFVRDLQRLFASYGTTADIYAHASAGCLHIRPMINLKTLQGVTMLRGISQEAISLTIQHGGAVSGEHGIGLARGEWLSKMGGEEIIEASKELKRAADPMGLLNPHKFYDAPKMDENLRYGAGYQSHPWRPAFDFSRNGGLDGAIEMCNGAGVCRKTDGVMCPSFQATHEEMHSTRGRANLLRALISRPVIDPNDQVISKAVHEALDLCLACKGCKAECPSSVDMAKLKYEFLDHYYESHRRNLRDYLFAYIGPLAKVGHPFAPLINTLLRSRLFKSTVYQWLKLTPHRPFPALSARSMTNTISHSGSLRTVKSGNKDCLLLSDSFTEYFHTEAGLSTVKVLSSLGYRVHLLPVHGAGRTLLSKGFLSAARRHAKNLVRAIDQLDPQGVLPIIGIEPSEIYALRDEYLDLIPDDPIVQKIAERAWMIDEFLVRPSDDGQPRIRAFPLKAHSERIILHGHCYQKAQPPRPDGYPTGTAATVKMLSSCGYDVIQLDTGCCGMAGAFGYETEHYDLSMKVGELALFPAIRGEMKRQGKTIIAAAGVSCQAQIKDGTGWDAVHPISLVSRLLDEAGYDRQKHAASHNTA